MAEPSDSLAVDGSAAGVRGSAPLEDSVAAAAFAFDLSKVDQLPVRVNVLARLRNADKALPRAAMRRCLERKAVIWAAHPQAGPAV